MSKWINESDFEKFQSDIKSEVENQANKGNKNPFMNVMFPTKDIKGMPWKGPEENPAMYEMRLLPNPSGGFYKKFYYHMFESPSGSNNWKYFQCPKTHDFNAYCPICSATNKLWTGSDDDKATAKRLKRKEKCISNIYLIDDPRDNMRSEDKKLNNSVLLYEFPPQVEKIIKSQLTDKKNGIGSEMFDPEDGYNLILKVGTNGTWPSYTMSTFSRRSSPVDDDPSRVDEIMSQRHEINEYIESNGSDINDMVDILKEEMLFDLIEVEHSRFTGEPVKKIEVSIDDEQKQQETPVEQPKETQTKETSDDSNLTNEDEELLAELANL